MFAYPLAWLGLAALPLLVGIYLLRTHSERRVVSSLLLWLDQQELQQGGHHLKRLHTPLLFFLELLALLLLALAAAGPLLKRSLVIRPLVVVLDDSYSMQAGADESARDRAVIALREILQQDDFRPYRFVLAGATPQTLGGAMETAEEALARLADWPCTAPAANLDAAQALAFELAGERGQVLVLTDGPPGKELTGGRLRWLAVGKAASNLAIVNATRTRLDDHDRLLVEVANYSRAAATTLLTTRSAAGEPKRETLRLEPGQLRHVVHDLPLDTPAITAELPPDAVALDNQVILLPEAHPAIRVELALADEELRELFAHAVATADGRLVTSSPQILITDQTPPPGIRAWVLRLHQDESPVAFAGPYVMDKSHPLMAGLSLEGVVWGASQDTALPGVPILIVGNVPLLSAMELPGQRQLLHLRLTPRLSTLPRSPNWPIFIWNLLDWRRSSLPGLRQVNLRLGAMASLSLPAPVDQVTIRPPRGTSHAIPVHDLRLNLPADQVGRYEIAAGDATYSFQVNPLQAAESDLQAAETGEWGKWAPPEDEALASLNYGWAILLLVLAVLLAHLYIMKRQPGALRA